MFERNRIDTAEMKAVGVELTLTDGDVLKGRIAVPAGRGLHDALNGSAQFFEFETYDGQRSFLSKSAIRDVRMLAGERRPELGQRLRDADGFDPLTILGLKAGATWEEIRQAYHRLSKTYHPDRYATAELPAEVAEYLAAMARRLNAAFAALEAPAQRARQLAAQRSAPIYTSAGGRSA